jgi:hypothetical protein
MSWWRAATVLKEIKATPGYVLSQMTADDVAPTVAALQSWYPEIGIGAESCHLDADFYHRQAALAGSSQDRPIFPVVAKHGTSVVAVCTFEQLTLARNITCRLGALDPGHRGGLALLGPILLEKIGRAVGAELAYYYAPLRTKHQQVLAERMRFRLVGIAPAFDLAVVGKGEVKRVYEAMYAKVLVDDDAVQLPELTSLTPRTLAVWKALYEATDTEE